jgi:hypothetical protein
MTTRATTESSAVKAWSIGGVLVLIGLCLSPLMSSAHDRRDTRQLIRLDPGTLISVRTNEMIETSRVDYHVYSGIVDRDVRGRNGGLVIRRGSSVELMVRTAPNNDLILDLKSVVVAGERYGIRANSKLFELQPGNSIVGAIFGAVTGGEIEGPVRVPRDTVVSFRLERPLEVGVPDRE